MKVAIVGATGQTGSVILDALLQSTSPKFQITALVRPSSLQKPAVIDLEKKGVKIVKADLAGPEDELVEALRGTNTVISAIVGGSVLAEIPLINASKAAGVERYVPCFFATVIPPKGVLLLRDMKEDVLNHIKKVRLPYTVIDVGWWYQVTLPRLPSGRIDYAIMEVADAIAGDGNALSALTDVQDIGKYVARIIADPRTLNRLVFAYNEVYTRNQVYDLLEKLSGEKLDRTPVSAKILEANIAQAEAARPGPDSPGFVFLAKYQYWYSCDIRGDNSPENARYLGYVTTKELYPDLKGNSFENYTQEALDGKAKRAYEDKKDIRDMLSFTSS